MTADDHGHGEAADDAHGGHKHDGDAHKHGPHDHGLESGHDVRPYLSMFAKM